MAYSVLWYLSDEENILSNSPRWAKPIAEPWFWGYWSISFISWEEKCGLLTHHLFLVSHHSLACHIQPPSGCWPTCPSPLFYTLVPQFPPTFPQFNFRHFGGWLVVSYSALTCSALFETMIPNSPIFLRRVKTTNYFTGQAGTDWLVCCSDSLQKHLQ